MTALSQYAPQNYLVSIALSLIDLETESIGSSFYFSWDCFIPPSRDSHCYHFDTEATMIQFFIDFLVATKPQLLIFYNHEFEMFPYLLERCQLLDLKSNFEISDYIPDIPLWFRRWCSPTKFGPFVALNLQNVVRDTYKIKGGNDLENVIEKLLMPNFVMEFLLSEEELKNFSTEFKRVLSLDKIPEKMMTKFLLCAKDSKLSVLLSSAGGQTVLKNHMFLQATYLIQLFKFYNTTEIQKLVGRPPMKVVKMGLQKVLKDQSHIEVIEDCVIRTHQLVVRGTGFLKSFLLHEFEEASDPICSMNDETNCVVPESMESYDIDAVPYYELRSRQRNIVNLKNYLGHHELRQLLRRMGIKKSQKLFRDNPCSDLEFIYRESGDFLSNHFVQDAEFMFVQYYFDHYIPILNNLSTTMGEEVVTIPSLQYLPRILDYAAKQIKTNYENNMSLHFHEHVFRLYNLVLDKKRRLKLLGKSARLKLLKKMNSVRDMIVKGDFENIPFKDTDVFPNPTSEATLYFLAYLKFNLFPILTSDKNLYYCQKADPLTYVSHAIYLAKITQSFFFNDDGIPVSAANPFPSSRSLIPKSIRLDTNWINERFVQLKGSADQMRKTVFASVVTDEVLQDSTSYVVKCSSIVTDGISCSVLMIRKDLVDLETGNEKTGYSAVQKLTEVESYIDCLSKKTSKN
ncbi:hypothetical protein GEMRC1_006252 [Eukaryota sp. GEM-RC1]